MISLLFIIGNLLSCKYISFSFIVGDILSGRGSTGGDGFLDSSSKLIF